MAGMEGVDCGMWHGKWGLFLSFRFCQILLKIVQEISCFGVPKPKPLFPSLPCAQARVLFDLFQTGFRLFTF